MKCSTCYLKHSCNEQMEFICKDNNYCKYMPEQKFKTKKEKLIEYINNPIITAARNSMGCSENWYNAYYAIKETFSIEEIKAMSNTEIENLMRLADAIGEALY